MRRQRRKIQGRLFQPERPVLEMTEERRHHLVELLGVLVQEVMTDRDAVPAGGDHDADHL